MIGALNDNHTVKSLAENDNLFYIDVRIEG